MSNASSEPTPSPLPFRRPSSPSKQPSDATNRPHPRPTFPIPKLRFEIRDLTHPGTALFLFNCDISTVLSSAVQTVLSTLYLPTPSNAHIPPTRSVTLVLEDMGGVAYTKGIELDDDHKEIHFSLGYIKQRATAVKEASEIQGVLVHEMVHCWQYNGRGKCPSGLVEGIADFVRLKAGLSPTHWKRPSKRGGKWDQGYQNTAYFLEWLEGIVGEGTVRKINASLVEKYEEEVFWKKHFEKGIDQFWKEYQETLPEGEDEKKNGEGEKKDAEEGEKEGGSSKDEKEKKIVGKS